LVPEAIYRKPKMGFGPPDASWYRGRLRPWIEELLRPLMAGGRGIFQGPFVRAILDEHFRGARNHYGLIWSLLNFEAWCRAFGFYGAAAPALARSA
jgi:asparagine synthase (glutamine-hydrolysing)